MRTHAAFSRDESVREGWVMSFESRIGEGFAVVAASGADAFLFGTPLPGHSEYVGALTLATGGGGLE